MTQHEKDCRHDLKKMIKMAIKNGWLYSDIVDAVIGMANNKKFSTSKNKKNAG